MKKIGVLLLVMSTCIGFTFAHQPRLIFDHAIGHLTQVQKPEVSQIFYGILSGQEDIYQIVSDTGFLLYVDLVVPNIFGSRTDFTVDIIEGNPAIYTRLDGKGFVWTKFYEPYGGNSYLQGPSRKKNVDAGIYTIRVNNPDKMGKYGLAIGKTEQFPIKEIFNTYKIIPELKMAFFAKPWYMIFQGRVGFFLLGTIVMVLLLIWGGIKLVKYSKKKQKHGL